MQKGHALVALGGGPSPVINASLQGVVERCMAYEAVGHVYAARHGIEGVLTEDFVNMGTQKRDELTRLRHTPSSGVIGTCRYKLGDGHEEDFARILDVLEAHEIAYFFYIGGNDSMDTADKIAALAKQRGLPLVVAGVPKTIDNDVGDEDFTLIDHTPGYGSAARYWAHIIQIAEEENRGMHVSESVSVWQAMGRKSGFITAAARLADPNREMPLQLYFAETGHTLDTLTENVRREVSRRGRCIVVVNEGFDAGDVGAARDGFGHVEYGASQTTAAQLVVNHLNRVGVAARGQATGQVPGILQRSSAIYRSRVDIEEAYEAGAQAVEIALRDGTGYMSTLLRAPGSGYRIHYGKVPLRTVANSERFLPARWIADGGIDVTDDFIAYAAPLIGNDWPAAPMESGLQRFARLELTPVAKRCGGYCPVGLRT